MFGDFPPSSSEIFFSVSAAERMIVFPTSTLPVNAILSTPGCPARYEPIVAPGPGTTLTTPGKQPASRQICPSMSAVNGVGDAGLRITALPAAIAGATFQPAMSSG